MTPWGCMRVVYPGFSPCRVVIDSNRRSTLGYELCLISAPHRSKKLETKDYIDDGYVLCCYNNVDCKTMFSLD